MENSLEKKNHPCKNCIISMVCTEPCDKYYPDICVLDKMVEYKRAINFCSFKPRVIILENSKNKYISIFDTIYFYKNDEFHRDGDKPAIIYLNGTQKYYKNGKSHRDGDKPAVIYPNGTKHYYKNGRLHRDRNKPAVIYSNGDKEYWKNGKRIKIKKPSV